MNGLTVVSLLADNARSVYQRLVDYTSRRAGIDARLVADLPWQERERLLDQGQAQVAFLCGLLYTRKTDQVELLAAPVMRAARYAGHPIYFSDLVVHRDSPLRSFAGLRGATLAYNDPGSFSGYAMLGAYLALRGERAGYFGRVVESGSHQQSLRLLAGGTADVAAIDSTVLELELELHPELASQVRVVETIGPSPIPPVVVARGVAAADKRQLRRILLQMDRDDEGQAILDGGMIARFVAVRDADYDDVRHKARLAAEVRLGI